jgi:hypothetical protein
MISTALITGLTLVALQAITLIAWLAFVAQLTRRIGCDSLFELFDLKND